MSDGTNTTPSTELTSQYIAQVTGDLESNVKEQERIGVEITALQEQLAALQRDHALLVNMQQALGIATPSTAPAAPAPPSSAPASVPAPRGKGSARKSAAAPRAGRATKRAASGSTATAKPAARAATRATGKGTGRTAAKTADKTAARTAAETATKAAADTTASSAPKAGAKTPKAAKTTAKTTAKAKAGKAAGAGGSRAGQPTLVELVRAHLSAQTEPRSAAEVTTALGQEHPDRKIQNTVVRTTLEGLVARNQAQRSKQGSSVFYTAVEGGEAAAQSSPAAPAGAPAPSPAAAPAADEEAVG
ncbi:hypothetical protein [Streptomyces anandii]|uniref:hypothetical protein n=1 Tax=Streptomyces anandii TaxID=285454 RepID=UPI00167C3ED2|nr:hypothetical protein [Streptomyces anandii]GGX96759.1 hypothetical protein GCM10010510_47720 [Streptomyces anandii JCM 4720]